METGVGLLSNLQGLRGAMGNLTPEDAAAIESKQYHKLSGKLQKVIMTYFNERLIPDLGALRENGFAMLEVLDDKYGASGDAISELQSAVDREDTNAFFPLADKALAILLKQDGEGFATFGGLYAGDNAEYLSTVSQRNTYMKEVQGHDRVISKYARLKDTNPEMANLVTPMLAFRSAENFIQAYGIPEAYAQGLRTGSVDFNSAPGVNLPTYKEMFIALSDSNVAFVNFKQRAKYARTGLVEDNSGNATMQMADGRRLTAAPFGPRLNDMSQAGVVQALERTQTGQGRNSIDAIETKLQLA